MRKWIFGSVIAALAWNLVPASGQRESGPGDIAYFLNPEGNPDGDSLTTEEEREYGTNPFNPDTDGDGMPE